MWVTIHTRQSRDGSARLRLPSPSFPSPHRLHAISNGPFLLKLKLVQRHSTWSRTCIHYADRQTDRHTHTHTHRQTHTHTCTHGFLSRTASVKHCVVFHLQNFRIAPSAGCRTPILAPPPTRSRAHSRTPRISLILLRL